MKRYGTLLVGLLVGVSVALGACGGGTSTAANTVTVTLSEYKITSSRTAFVVGTPYHFVVRNAGKSSHEFMIMPPVSGDMTMNMGNMDKMSLYHIPQPELSASATRSFDFTFKDAASAGKLEMACHVGNHYQLGMRLPLSVTK
ncbi:MAG: hypothetical protein IVW57_17425 [Ktedonobacterales bacterium]|nr:hypothetical protein [Ktedonobacterales bacterium]